MDIDSFLVSLLEEINTVDFVEKIDIQRLKDVWLLV